MKIAAVHARLYERAMDQRLWNPVHRWRNKPILLIFVVTDTGRIGVGEAATSVSPGSPYLATVHDELAPMVEGRSVHDVRAITTAVLGRLALNQSFGVLGAALSGLEIALWDLIGQEAGLPLHKLFGSCGGRVFGYASSGLYRDGDGLEELAAEMGGYAAEGYTGFKLKIGGLKLEEDLARIEAVRKAVGPEARLMIDAAGAYDTIQAERFEAMVRPLGLYWFEAPVKLLDWTGLARFRQRTSIPVAAHEGLFGLHAYDALIREEAVDFVQFNVTCCGGMSEAHRIAARAAAANLPTTLQFSGSFVGFAASLHAAASIERCDSVEVHMIHQWLSEYRDGEEWRREGSYFIPGDRPGLGLSDAVRRALLEGN